MKVRVPSLRLLLSSYPERVFFFSLWESLFCPHVAFCPGLTACRDCSASQLGEFLRSFSWCQTSLLQRLHWGTVRWVRHPYSKKDSGKAWVSWKYWRLNKNVLWERRSREMSRQQDLSILCQRSWSVLLLHLTISNLNHSLPLLPAPFFCLRSLSDGNQIVGSGSAMRKK